MDIIDRAVKAFSKKMLHRMGENKHKRGWDNTMLRRDFEHGIAQNLREAIEGRPEACIDIANYAMMLHRCLRLRLKRCGIPGVRNTLSPVLSHRHRTD